VVVKVTPGGVLSIVAGNGKEGAPRAGLATSSSLGGPAGVAVDGSGNVFIADTMNNVVEKVTPGGVLSIVAGNGKEGPPRAGLATSSSLPWPGGLAVDHSGNVFIADSVNSVVERVTPDGVLSIIAGTLGFSGAPSAGPATSSKLHSPSGVAVDASGNLFIADVNNDEVVKLSPAR
jgi:sugar lactone lactonase YvrE